MTFILNLIDVLIFFQWPVKLLNTMQFEPPHDKTNEMAYAPSEDQINLGIRPV